jgi:chromosome segregation ATPase
MMQDIYEPIDMNQLPLTRYQEHEEFVADLDDDKNSRLSRDRRRYAKEIKRLERQLEDLHAAHDVSLGEVRNLRRDRDSHQDEAREAEAGFHRQQGEITQRDGVIKKINDQLDKMRGDSINLRIKLEEIHGQRSSLRKDLQELRATLEDRDSRLEDMRVMLENRNDEVAAMEERVTHTREERDRLQLRHNAG